MFLIEAALARGRAAAEARMLDTCRITKPGVGAPTIDPVTLAYVDPASVVVYEGKCYVPGRTAGIAGASSSAAAGAAWQVGEFPLSLPVEGTELVAPGQTVTYLSSVTDPALVGQVFGITAPDRQSQATARRFRMKQVVGGGQ